MNERIPVKHDELLHDRTVINGERWLSSAPYAGNLPGNRRSSARAAATPFVQILQAGSTLDRGRYEVLKPLKSGGMGAVYLLHDNRLERECVLKEMVPPSHDRQI